MSPLKIGLLWHSANSDNLGVGALTLGHIALIERAAAAAGHAVQFEILQWADPRPVYVTGKAIAMRPLRLADFARPRAGFVGMVRGLDLVLDIGGGDSFSDIYGPARIAKMIAAQNLVRLAGVPLIMSPQTIGPFKSPLIRRAALSVLRSADLVATRDRPSIDCMRDMGFDGDIIRASDVALALPYETPAPRDGGKIRVGVNVSGLLMNGGHSQDNQFSLSCDYRAVTRRLAAHFAGMPDVELHLVGHVISDTQETEDDWRACEALARQDPGAIVAPKFSDPIAAKTYIAGMDFFIGARMHACIAALSSGTPVAPLAYSRKFAGLFGGIGYHASADCRALSSDAVFEAVIDAFAQRQRLGEAARAATAKGLALLGDYEHALSGFMIGLRQERACA